jgi:hypothetical protein
MTIATPAIPQFFCAPAKTSPYFEISIGFERKFDDMSATRIG